MTTENKTITASAPLLREILESNTGWFSYDNKKFFNDVEYFGCYGKATGKAYLVRSTYAWSDMFGQPRKLQYRINNLNQNTRKIEPLIDTVFSDIDEVKDWLREN